MSKFILALKSSGFVRAFLYSLGSFIAGWVIIFANDKDIALSLGQYAFAIPVINILAVYAKQVFDEFKK